MSGEPSMMNQLSPHGKGSLSRVGGRVVDAASADYVGGGNEGAGGGGAVKE